MQAEPQRAAGIGFFSGGALVGGKIAAELGEKLFDGNPVGTMAFGGIRALGGGALGKVVGQRADICRNFLDQEYRALILAREQLGVIVAKVSKTNKVDADFLQGLDKMNQNLHQLLALAEKLRHRSINPPGFQGSKCSFRACAVHKEKYSGVGQKIDEISYNLNL